MTFSDKNNSTILFLIFALIIWNSALFIESSQQPAQIFQILPGLDKVAHFIAFSVSAFLLYLLTARLEFNASNIKIYLPLFIVFILGVSQETYQFFVPGRSASLWDLAADMLGAISAVFLANNISIFNRGQ
jgi:VanZ family protein